MIWIRALELPQRLERKTGINPWLATKYGSRLIAFPKLLTQKKENKMAKRGRPKKDQPFYHLLAENDSSYYIAYVSEQNLLYDDSGEPVGHPEVKQLFGSLSEGRYLLSDIMH